jgi:hypothetical protein
MTFVLTALSLETLAEINLTEGRAGRGTITFGPIPPITWGKRGNIWMSRASYGPPCFVGIQDARAVYGQIQQAQHAAMQRDE